MRDPIGKTGKMRICMICGRHYRYNNHSGSKTGIKTCSLNCRYIFERKRKNVKKFMKVNTWTK